MTAEIFDEKAKEIGEALGKQMWDLMLGAIDQAVARPATS